MQLRLKGGSITTDRRLDRIVQFDEASRTFPIRTLLKARRPRSMTWRLNIRLDQGNEGACVGFGVSHELAAMPAEAVGLTNDYARRHIYWEAQKIDNMPGGAYPNAVPFYEGTSVLAGVKVAHRLGWMQSYRWAFGIDDLILAVGHNGPAVLGLNWYEGMQTPDATGRIRPTGRRIGGHCILTRGVNIQGERFQLPNSWGRRWGIDGECFLSFADMDRLLREDGEAVLFIKRHKTPKGPTA